MMDPTERIFAAIEGKEVDRVPTFCASLDDWPVQQVLGKPLIPPKLLFKNPLMSFVFDRWGPKLKKGVYELPHVAPAVMYVPNARQVKNVKEGLAALRKLEPGTGAVVEGEPPPQGPPEAAVTAGRITRLEPNHVVAEIEVPGPGLIVVAEAYYPAWLLPEDHPLLQKGIAAFTGQFGSDPEVGVWTFSTNGVATMGLFDIPTIGFGPGHEEHAHMPTDQLAVSELCKALEFYTAFIVNY